MTINTSDTADVIYTSHPAHEVVMKAFKAEKKKGEWGFTTHSFCCSTLYF